MTELGLLFVKLALSGWAFFRKHWKLVLGGLVLLFLLGRIGILKLDVRSLTKARDQAQANATALEQRNTVTTASLGQCRVYLNEKNAETEQRAAELQAARVANARDVATADARLAADHNRIAALEALARAPANPACRASPELLHALEGL